MMGSYFGLTVLIFMLSCAGGDLFDGYTYTDERMRDVGDFMSHLEDDTPNFDSKDCCPYDCTSDLGCGWNDFNTLNPDALSKLSNYNELASRTLTAPPCLTGTSKWVVESAADVQALAEAVNCSDGSFDVEWIGSIVVEKTILIVDGTVLNITGIGPIAAVDGGDTTNLFAVSNASLHLSNVNVSNGNAINGGAIVASSSKLIFDRTMFFENAASFSGGVLFVSNNSVISISGETSFVNNHANDSGGALYIGYGCSISWSGNMSFLGNAASSSGGAMFVSSLSNASWEGEATFTGNTATMYGGAIMVGNGGKISWSGEAKFSYNIAKLGGALYVLGAGKAIWEGKNVFTNNNATGSGGAVCLDVGGSASWMGQSIFSGNMAYGWAGGAMAVMGGNSTISWKGENTTLSGNTAYGIAGVIFVSGPGSTASWGSNTHFLGNTAVGGGGALVVQDGASASWSGETTFYNNSANSGGALIILLGSDVRYSGDTSFINNSASNGGAIMVGNGGKISWSGEAKFSHNIAKLGGALYVLGAGKAIWEGKNIFTNNNATGSGGAVCLNVGGSASWMGQSIFSGNMAYGWAGGAMAVMGSNSTISWKGENTTLSGNTAYGIAGAILVSGPGSTASWGSNTHFLGNTAVGGGGALVVQDGASASWSGETTFYNNSANSGGALIILLGSDVRYSGDTSFINNSASNGGAIMVGNGGKISWSGEAKFSHNIAKLGGALYVLGAGKAIWEGKNIFTNNNATGSGGAVCLNVGGSASWMGQSIFSGNMAYGWAGGAMAVMGSNSTISWKGENTTLSGNTAYGIAGAILVSGPGSTASWGSNTHFLGNTAVGGGGALVVRNNASASWSGEIKFYNNSANSGGALIILLGSDVRHSGDTSFINNSASVNGGAIMVGNGSRMSWSGEAKFSHNIAKLGGALYVSEASEAIWEGKNIFTNNNATGSGGAVCLNVGGSASWMGQSIFSGNMAYGWAGGAMAVMGGNSTISWKGENTTLSGNTAHGMAGAIFVSSPGSTASWGSNTHFLGNTAVGEGGALVVRNGASALWSGETTFYNNSANSGGALFIDDGSQLSWSGRTIFSGNTAPDAGAMLVDGIDAIVSWTSPTYFYDNAAADQGGAVLVQYGASATWSGETTFYNNSAKYGGALFIGDGVDVELSGDTQFRSNYARSDGGAVASFFTSPNVSERFPDLDSSLVINATTTVANNTSEGNGGGIALLTSVSLEINTPNLTFDGNYAAISGGAMFISGSELGTVFDGTRFIRNSAYLGGGIYSTVIGSEIYSTTFKRCSFVDNVAKASGGAMNSLAGYDSFVNTSFAGNMAVVGGALRLAGVAKIENCTFVDNVSGENEGPAVSNIGVLSEMTESYFRNNFFHCDAGMYREFVEEDDSFRAICDGCDDVSCNECSIEDQLTPKCSSVMEHSTSTGGAVTIDGLEIEGGYWRASTSSTTILACYNVDACVGGVTGSSSYCTDGYEGPYCSVCRKDYMANQEFTCSKCSSNTRDIVATVVLAVVGVALVAVIILYLVSPDMEGTGRGVLRRVAHFVPLKSLKIIINAWQILTQFSAVANVTFPGVYQRFLDGVDFLNFDLAWMLSIGCIIDVDFHDRLLISTLGPIVVTGFLGMTYAAAVRKNQGSEEALQNIRYKNVSMALLLTFLVYSNVSATVFQMFACDDVDDGNNYLKADYRIQCDSTRHRIFQIYAGFMIIIYPVGIPALYAVLLFRSRGLLKDKVIRVHALDVKSTSDLWKPYKPSRFYYEVIECGRRIALTGVVVFIYPNTAAQIAVALLMSFAFTVISECLDPYESRWDSWLNRTGNIVVFASMFLGLALKVDVSNDNARSQKVFEAVFVAVHGGMILLVVVEAVTTAYALVIEEQNRPKPRYSVGRTLPSSRIMPTVAVAPTSEQCSNTPGVNGQDESKDMDSIIAELGC